MKKIILLSLAAVLSTAMLTGCGGDDNTSDKSSFDTQREITVVSREDGSGTRGAFIELMKIEEKGSDGTKTDKTTKDAVIANKTDVMLTNISGDPYAIGYVSLGSLSSAVKAIKVDGVEATSENVKAGSYKVSRPFNIATKDEPTGLAKDFISFILSADGQKVVSGGYIPIDDAAAAYAGDKPSGKITVSGSSSVTPIMEKLKEAYIKINTDATIEIQQSDSTSGMQDAINGNCDIGMASRELKDSEKQFLTSTPIALDGIAIIVNPKNTVDNMTSADIKDIFTGTKTAWSDFIS